MPSLRSLVTRGFARRLLVLFVLCTMLPLALSDWLATSALSSIARDSLERQQTRTVRQASLQVFDRLIAARAVLLGIADQPGAPLPNAASRTFVGVGRRGATDAASVALQDAWDHARSTSATARPFDAEAAAASLRTLPRSPRGARLLLGAGPPDRPDWIAELRPDLVWAPLVDSGGEQAWTVTDGSGHALVGDASASRPRDAVAHATALFLRADFGVDDWNFAAVDAAPAPAWHGMSLAAWLALLTLGAAALTALLGVRLLRGTLGPLQRLTDGTRALAAGDATARVRIDGDDEFARLGDAFNDMAGRIDAQIRSLGLLASIDRDVLTGTDIAGVARSVVERFAAVRAGLDLAVVWHDGVDEPGRSGAVTVVRRRADRSPGPAGIIETLHPEVDASNATLVSAALFEEDPARPVKARALRWSERSRGWFIVGATPAEHAAVDRLADELCDRLAVVFSAREREAEMAWRAGHDGLTGLANRHGLHAVVDALLRDARSFAVLFVDLDRFKDANDTLGHEVGDRVLCEAARRLRRCAPTGTTVVRQGGDEFVLVLPNAELAEAERIAREVVGTLALPFALGGEPHTFGASVGVALAPLHGTDRHALLRRADTAMYAAKAAGRGRHASFDVAFEAAAESRLRLPGELRRALERHELLAYFQPRVDAKTGTVASAEALVRWQHPERGLVLPQDFIPLAEESQLIEDIGRFMLDAACRHAAHWRRTGTTLRRISVNVSPRQLASGRLIADVRSALQRYELPADALELEITESLIVADPRGARLQLAELRDAGVTIALDDFGSGYSSMTSLRDLPLDVMKIDRAFVKDLGREDSALAVVRAIATLGRDLRMTLVAEGVETAQQAEILCALGCDELQGYLYAKPMPADWFEAFIAARSEAARGATAETALA